MTGRFEMIGAKGLTVRSLLKSRVNAMRHMAVLILYT